MGGPVQRRAYAAAVEREGTGKSLPVAAMRTASFFVPGVLHSSGRRLRAHPCSCYCESRCEGMERLCIPATACGGEEAQRGRATPSENVASERETMTPLIFNTPRQKCDWRRRGKRFCRRVFAPPFFLVFEPELGVRVPLP